MRSFYGSIILLTFFVHAAAGEELRHNRFSDIWDAQPPKLDEVPPVLSTPTGQLQGYRVLSETLRRKFTAYSGIPYAKPPVGRLRFKAPEPADPWEGVLNASGPSVICPQLPMVGHGKPSGQEDCLVLNVYIPEVDRIISQQSLPVMVAIHGGAYQIGSGGWEMLSPTRFMDQDIILVTFNYRLGALGFLSTGDEASQGNYGLMDQSLVLRWVKNNIAAFHGDPSRVTISGVSAGGGSVTAHLLSPISSGLFRGAIAQSGSVLSPWSFERNPLRFAKKLAHGLACPTDDTKELMECVRQKEITEVLLAVRNMTTPIHFLVEELVFTPVVDGAFFPDEPLILLKEGRINKVPVILGATTAEGIAFQLEWTAPVSQMSVSDYMTTFEDRMTAMLWAKNEGLEPEVLKGLREKYFLDVDTKNSETLKQAIINVLGDFQFCAPIQRTADLLAQVDDPMPVYFYEFSHLSLRLFNKYMGVPVGNNASHGDDIGVQFTFCLPAFSNGSDDATQTQIASDKNMAFIINSFWSNFATNSIPKAIVDSEEVVWTPYTPERMAYLQLDTTPQMKLGSFCKEVDLWRHLAESRLKKHLERQTRRNILQDYSAERADL